MASEPDIKLVSSNSAIPRNRTAIRTAKASEDSPAQSIKPPCTEPDFSDFTENLDKAVHAAMARLTAGLSPSGLASAVTDWSAHLSSSPGKQIQLLQKAVKKAQRLTVHTGPWSTGGIDDKPCIDPLPQDRRFSSEAWQRWPFNYYYQSFLLTQQWWHNATTGVRGTTPQHEKVVEWWSSHISV